MSHTHIIIMYIPALYNNCKFVFPFYFFVIISFMLNIFNGIVVFYFIVGVTANQRLCPILR